jgi:hypothetical protein
MAKSPTPSAWLGVGARIRECLRERGYWRAEDNRPDAMRFALDKRIAPQQVYKWLNDEALPDRVNLERLGREFGVNPAWLAWGDEYAPRTYGEELPKKARPRQARGLPKLLVALSIGAGLLWPNSSGAAPRGGESWGTARYPVPLIGSRRLGLRLACA